MTGRVLRSRSGCVPLFLLLVMAFALGCSVPSNFLQPSLPGQNGRRAALLAMVGSAATAQPLKGVAMVPKSSYTLAGYYADPFHPGCKRQFVVDEGDVKIRGRDGEPDCLKGTQGPNWVLPVQWKLGSETIIIDFSPKGGPKSVVGTWVGDGIVFPDGNKWKKIA
mmetsp:Transcript_49720/g.96042  ORF Transcript_49720/g.96042 Transcript_49720/m.96042 type:complete len:165 (-) Transcript_49720:78-572(-)